MKRAFATSTLAVVVACGGAQPKPPEPPPAELKLEPSTPSATPVAARAPQTPLDRLKSLGIRDGADLAFVIDGDRTRASVVGSVLEPLMTLGKQFFQLACNMSPLEDFGLGAGSFFTSHERLYAALETKHSAREWVRCAARLTKHVVVEEGQPVPPAEDTVAEGGGMRFEAFDEHTLVVSPSRDGRIQPNAVGRYASLGLTGDQMFEAQGDLPLDEPIRNIRFEIRGDANAASAHVALDLPDGKGVGLSNEVESERRKLASGGGPSRERPLLKWLFAHVRYTITGDHLDANLALGKPDVAALVDIGQDILGREFRGYGSHGKASEARSTLRMMSASAMAWFENEVPDPKQPGKSMRQTKCPPSAPLTPAKVPKGDTYSSKPSDWTKGGWSVIHFSVSQPQRYSYGIDTSKDGKTCTFYAVGDTNGNGKKSRFELVGKVRVPTPGSGDTFPSLSFGPAFIETAPEE